MSQLEERLRLAKVRAERALHALAPKHVGGEMEECNAAMKALYEAERAVAAAAGEEYAVPISMPQWDVGSPLPHLLQTDYQTTLIYILSERELAKVSEPEDLKPVAGPAEHVAVVQFDRCICSQMGTPNDEVFDGHRLYGKGFEPYEAMIVENSRWIAELERINSVHSCYRPEHWRLFRHYILPFHDSTFECVAKGFKVETRLDAFQALICEFASRP